MNSSNYKIKRAIISVSDKSGIVELASALKELGIEIFSTGGTAKLLRENNIPARSVTEITGSPEILDGRVKTLHPAIHAGLLAKMNMEDHIGQLKEHNIKSIDLLIVNLYPFEATLEKTNKHDILIENIDIGGPTMLRAAAKNYLWTAPVVNPEKYPQLIEMLRSNDCTLSESFRAELAFEVFEHTAWYDILVSGYFKKYIKKEASDQLLLGARLAQSLRYGENPHQKAYLYGKFESIYKKLHGKELSYNNFLDIDSASKLILEFDESAVAIIKHTNPCGVAVHPDIKEAYKMAYATDKVSPFGGIIISNRKIDAEFASEVHALFTELIIAPAFDREALEILTKKKDRRLIEVDFKALKSSLGMEIKSIAGGFLVQQTDMELISYDNLKVVTKRSPTEDEMKALLFAWKIAKHVKSNAIIYTNSERTLAIGAGQMSRVDSARIAVEKAKLEEIDLKGSVVASDAYFPYPDGVEHAADAGVTAIIQPGGSVRDELVIQAADEKNIAMVFTGMRHFKH